MVAVDIPEFRDMPACEQRLEQANEYVVRHR